jgi:DHA1 family tetracycline resistance protein-like MFS transporter
VYLPTTPGSGSARVRRSPLIAVYLTVFIDLLGFSIILPLLPYYAEHYGATGAWVGALLTAYAAMQFLSAPVLGRLSDRYGRRPILLISLAGSAAGLVLTGLAHSLWLLLLARIIDGASGGSIATAQAYIADATPPEERARYMGLLGAAVGLGFTLGPGIGGALNVFGFSTAAFAAAALAAANLCFAASKLPETRRRTGSATGALPSLRAIAATLREPALGRTLWAGFLATFAFTGLEATYALFGQRYFGLTGGSFAALFTYIGVLGIVTQGFLVRRLARRFGEARLAAAGAALLALMLLAAAAARTLPAAIVVITLLALGQGLLSPMLPALLSLAGSAEDQGHTLGIGQSLQAAARAVGPIVAGALFDVSASLPYIAGGALTLLAALLLLRVRLPARAAAALPREAVAVRPDYDP